MPNKISPPLAILPDDVINKIAAGEVIERPASIVRELVDNAIDAGASSVSIEVRDGGQSLVKVSDDGSGMSQLEAELCFKRHATSKIKDIADLEAISSLGFRGEALSSIASVSQVQLRTKRKESELGSEIILQEGRIVSNKSCSVAEGSEFEVTKLFANLPARRKFLKSPRTDLARLQEWAYQSALANPKVRYRLIAEGREVFRLAASSDIFSRLEVLLTGSTVRVNYSAGPFSVRGMIAHPSQADFKVGGFVFLVNSRPIQDRMLMRALRDAWSTGIRPGENPIGALEIILPASEVDINVHPQKSEVRFRNSQAVFASLYKAVKFGLSEWKPSFVPDNKHQVQVGIYNPEIAGISESLNVHEPTRSIFTDSTGNFQFPQMSLDPLSVETDRLPGFITERYIGQILGVFLIFERADKTFLVDAHAAHERVRYNELQNWASKKSISSQKLLIEEKVELLEKEVASLLEKQEQLVEYGIHFKVQSFGLAITEMPSSIKMSELPSLLKGLAELDVNDVAASIQKVIEKVLARTACRSSVMSGMRLSETQAQALWEQIRKEPQGAVCPHGRPVMVELSRTEIDKMFFRDGF